MHTYIGILSIGITCIMSLHAMKIEPLHIQSPLLTENTLYVICKQQLTPYTLIKQVSSHREPLFSSVALSEMREYFCNISDDCKRTIIKTMSTPLLLLSCAAICLPPELVKEHICLSMMDGGIMPDLKQKEINDLKEKIGKAVEQFYTTPIGQAFNLYQTIKIWLADDTKPIGPVYAMPQAERNALLGVKLSWYYSAPLINAENEELLNGLTDELKQMYLQGKNPVVLDNETQKKLCKSIGIGCCVFGCTFSSITAIGAWGGCLTLSPFWLFNTVIPLLLSTAAGRFLEGSGPCCRPTNF